MSNAYKENFANALDTVLGMRRMAENAWEEEQIEATHAVLELQAQAYDLGVRENSHRTSRILCGQPTDQLTNPYEATK
jgi:hypothetical protein